MAALSTAFVAIRPTPESQAALKSSVEKGVRSADTGAAGKASGTKYATGFNATASKALTSKLKASQLDLVAAQERLSVTAKKAGVSQGELAAAESSVIKAQERVTATTMQLTAAQAKEAEAAKAARIGMLGNSAQAGKFSAAMDKAAKRTVLAGVAIAGVSIKMAADFQTAMTRLVTAAGESESNFKMVSAGVLDVAKTTGTSTTALSKGMYQIESAGFHGAAGLKVLKAAAQGAKVENADLGSVSNALTTVMEDLHAPVGTVSTVMSQMVTAVGHGKMTMDDLAGSIHSVLPNAAALHLSFAEVAGALSTMTAQGIGADQAAQNLNHTIVKLAAPTLGMTKAMASYDLSAADVAKNLGKKGLTGTLDELVKAILEHMGPAGLTLRSAFNESAAASQDAGRMFSALPPKAKDIATAVNKGTISLGDYRKEIKKLPAFQANLLQQWNASNAAANGFSAALRSGGQDSQTFTAALKDMLGDQTGLQVALHLTGKAQDTFNANVKAIGAATSETGGNVKDWAVVQETLNVKLAKMRETGQVLLIQLGTALIPVFTKVITVVSSIVNWFEKHSTAAKALGIVVGGLLTVSIIRMTTAWIAANVAFVATPIGAVITSVVALAAAITVLWIKWDTIWNWISHHKALAATIAAVLAIVAPFTVVTVALVALGKNWDTVFSTIKTVVRTVANFLYTGFLNPVLAVFGAIVHGAASAFGWVPVLGPKLKGAAHAFDVFRDGVNNAIDNIRGVKKIKVVPDYPTAASTESWLNSYLGRLAGTTSDFRFYLHPPAVGANALPTIPGAKKAKASGGWVFGAGTARSDSIAAMLSNGEFVVNAYASARNGPLLEAINTGKTYANTGHVKTPGASTYSNAARLGDPGMARQITELRADLQTYAMASASAADRPVVLQAQGIQIARVVDKAHAQGARR